MNAFTAAAAKLSAAVDDVFGETFHMIPMLPGGAHADAQPDPDRAAFDAIGVFNDAPHRMKILSRELAGRDFDRRIASRATYATIEKAALSGRDVRSGDRLQRSDADGQPLFEIGVIEPDGVSRTKFNLIAVTS